MDRAFWIKLMENDTIKRLVDKYPLAVNAAVRLGIFSRAISIVGHKTYYLESLIDKLDQFMEYSIPAVRGDEVAFKNWA